MGTAHGRYGMQLLWILRWVVAEEKNIEDGRSPINQENPGTRVTG
jgi:hypothetical protein